MPLVEAPRARVVAMARGVDARYARIAQMRRERAQHRAPTPRPCHCACDRDVVELGDQRAARRRDRVADDARADGRVVAARASQTKPELRACERTDRAPRRAPPGRRRHTRAATRGSVRRRRGSRPAARSRGGACGCRHRRADDRRACWRAQPASARVAAAQRLERARMRARHRQPGGDRPIDPDVHESPGRRRRRRRPGGRARSRRPPTTCPSCATRKPASIDLRKRQRLMEPAARLDDEADRRRRRDVEAACADQVLVHHGVEVRVVRDVVDVAVACRCPSSASGSPGNAGSRARGRPAARSSRHRLRRCARRGVAGRRACARRAARSSGAPARRVPACEMRHAADVRGRDDVGRARFERGELVGLAAAPASSGCRIEYVPAEPQHRCASATGSELEPDARAGSPRPGRGAACRAAACTANGTRRAAGRGPSRSSARCASIRPPMTSTGSRASAAMRSRLAAYADRRASRCP